MVIKRQIYTITCWLLLIPNYQIASEREPGYMYYNLNMLGGRMTPHYESQAIINDDYIWGIDFNTYFLKDETTKINKTAFGLGYFVSNLGNDDIFGFVHSTYFSLLIPISPNAIPIHLKIGLGPGYATKKYSPSTNPQNKSIGSNLNAYGQIGLSGGFPVKDDRLFLRLGFSFNHISNGLIVSPNQGINTITVHAGLDFASNHKHSGALSVGYEQQKKGKNRFALTYAMGIKEAGLSNGEQIITSSLIFDHGYRVTPSFSAGLGISLFYNDTWSYHPYTSPNTDLSPLPYQSALHLALELDKSPISIILHPGYYIYKPSEHTPNFTGRLGVRYSLSNNITFLFAIKHHWFALADFFEFGIGYKIYR